LAQFRIRIERQPDQAGVLRIARAQNLSVYDAAYLELAYREKLPLAALDRRLGKGCAVDGRSAFRFFRIDQ
jgi:predicted nucleic acid-binding protein